MVHVILPGFHLEILFGGGSKLSCTRKSNKYRTTVIM